jgi:hypothetical protein
MLQPYLSPKVRKGAFVVPFRLFQPTSFPVDIRRPKVIFSPITSLDGVRGLQLL